ncbi:putative ornithine aminotransferase [Fusarium oxysporum f. sp. conglutinans]|nr:putative ornithine aminotransferase [Fusarium oxysporum f. sp. conglutinans]
MMEPIHGTLRTFEQEINFATGVRQLCKKYNVLFISDEVRMGSGKTGRFLCSDWLGSENKPDMITLGKSIAGGAYPASYVLGFNDTMGLIEPNQVASTFAMSPAATAATLAALSVYEDEKLLQRVKVIQDRWMAVTSKWNHPFLNFCTARGSDLCIMFKENVGGVTPRRVARLAYQKGVLVYPQSPRIRISVALTITDEELGMGLRILTEVMDEIAFYGEIPGSTHRVDDLSAGF